MMEHIYEAFVNGADACLASEHIPLWTYTVGEVKEYLRGKGVG
jgi:imidazole glycerol phosphate synthase subunit HisF